VSVLSHQSAARFHGLDLLDDDGRRHVTVPRNYSTQIAGAVTHRADLPKHDVAGGITTPLRTVLDLARTLHPAAALVTADSALRHRLLRQADLRARAEQAAGPGAGLIRAMAHRADGRSGAAMESLARWHLLEAGLPVRPQVRILPDGHPYDLAVVGSRVLVEIAGTATDQARMTVTGGFVVVTFSGDQVRHRPRWMVDVVSLAARRNRTRG
jgi:hypothetical protein